MSDQTQKGKIPNIFDFILHELNMFKKYIIFGKS
jgi:hypothetical protein